MSLHRIHSSCDGFSPRAHLTPWQRKRRDGPLAKMERVVRASPESIWDVAGLWSAVFFGMVCLGLLAAVLA